MLTRKDLVEIICDADHLGTCPNNWDCKKEPIDENCKECADRLLAEYEKKLIEENNRWNLCSEITPPNPHDMSEIKSYLVCSKEGKVGVLMWCYGWNCCFDLDGSIYRVSEIKNIVKWRELPEV